ncbi:hypothetical protein EV121DRAFT_168776, partial [Schizophyllum commune]
RSLAGIVRTAEEQKDASGNTIMQLSFQDRDAAKKALCMNGYTVSGTALIVTRGPSTDGPSMQSKYPDMRRNLYVLGLPFALTKSEFTAIFSKYGTVAHCVILATVDNASRRRGFVVMSTHEEAKNAMANLSRTQIKGHTLDISWAVVQRSQGARPNARWCLLVLTLDVGFLDGGDRAMFMADNPDSRNPSLPNASDLAAYESSLTSTATILVTNLPSVLFSNATDLRPLLCPFGTIKNLQVINVVQESTTTVLVEYQHPAEAEDAHKTLKGQSYAQFSLEVQYLRP